MKKIRIIHNHKRDEAYRSGEYGNEVERPPPARRHGVEKRASQGAFLEG